MKRAALAALAVAMLATVAAVAYARGIVPRTEGCVIRSIDKRTYVTRNEAVLRSLPLPPVVRAAHANTWSHAIPAANKCLPFYENGPPYSAYVTTYVFLRKPGGPPLGFDASVLRPLWIPQTLGTPNGTSYRRGLASLFVATTDEGVELSVDHRAYAGRD